MLSAEQASTLVLRSQRDPAWWVAEMLGFDPWGMQAEIMQAVANHPRVAVKTANGTGKSAIAAAIAIWHTACFPSGMTITTATKFDQAKDIIWKEIHNQLEDAAARAKRLGRPGLGIEDLMTALRVPSIRSMAKAMTAPPNDATKMQGFRGLHTLIIIDEACGVSREIYEAVDSMLTGENVRLLMIGNPTDHASEFAREFKAESSTVKITVPAWDTPNLSTFGITRADIASGEWAKKIDGRKLPRPYLTTPQWVRQRWEKWTGFGQRMNDPRWVARVEAQFPTESDDTLIPMHWIEAAHRIAADLPPERMPLRRLGLDVARKGSDNSVIGRGLGVRFKILESVNGHDAVAVSNMAKRHRIKEQASVVKVDVIGVGGPVHDFLKAMGEPAIEVDVSTSARDSEQYYNFRAEAYWELRERFENTWRASCGMLSPEGKAYVPEIVLEEEDEDLDEELHAIKWKIKDGRILIVPKEETVAELGRSPDRADCCMLTFADPTGYVPTTAPSTDVGHIGNQWAM